MLVFGGLWSAGGAIFVLLEQGILGPLRVYPSTGVPYDYTNNMVSVPLVSFLGGFILMGFDILVVNKRVKHKSFLAILLIKTTVFLLIILTTTTLSGLFATSATVKQPPWHPEVLQGVGVFLKTFAFWSIILYAGFLTVLYLFMMEVSNTLGPSAFWNFFTGRYHRSKVERRIFMFLDLTSSTSIAEKLGHVRYYDFLNRFFNDISAAVLVSWGNIYQYVGDEVVVFWPADRNTESVRCFFMIKEKIESGRAYYESEFGLVPQFRAGIHGGQVSIGEIGTLKKDILFIGDVLNATSRIQGLCKEEDVDLLVSEDVLQPKFTLFKKKYKIRDTGQRDLRGKNERLRLFHLIPFD